MDSVYIWGIGARYQRDIKKIKSKYEILGYIDNNRCISESNYQGKRLISSNQINNNMNVLITVQSYVSLAYELISKGIEDFIIGCYEFPDSFQEKLIVQSGHFSVYNKNLIYMYNDGRQELIKNQEDISMLYQKMLEHSLLDSIGELPVLPSCRDFGSSRGTPIDRIYIERFLEKNKRDIRGTVLEIADNTYTLKYGEKRIDSSVILHVNGWGKNAIKGNLETGEGIEDEQFDAAIITQTLMFIFDLKSAVKNIHKMLKPGGVALLTVASISQISRSDEENWGSYWSFHRGAIEKLFQPIFGQENVSIESFGNVKTATSFLYGITYEESDKSDFDENDLQYPVILGIRVEKKK